MEFSTIQPFARFVRQMSIQSTAFPPYLPLDARLFYVLEGEGKIITGGREHSLPAGSILFINTGCEYQILPCPASFLIVNFDFTFSHASLDIPVPPINISSAKQHPFIERVHFDDAICFNEYCSFRNFFHIQRDLQKLEKAYVQKLPNYKQECSHILALILIEIFRKSEARQEESRFDIEQIITYIHNNYASPIDNQTVANIFHFHPNYISSEFKRQTGKPLHQYILETRMLAAVTLMEKGYRNISVIAEETGFSDTNYFIRYFKKTTGITPAKYIRSFLYPS